MLYKCFKSYVHGTSSSFSLKFENILFGKFYTNAVFNMFSNYFIFYFYNSLISRKHNYVFYQAPYRCPQIPSSLLEHAIKMWMLLVSVMTWNNLREGIFEHLSGLEKAFWASHHAQSHAGFLHRAVHMVYFIVYTGTVIHGKSLLFH